MLNEVVVTGYMSEKKASLTGSVAVVKMKDVADIPTGNILTGLQGRVAGMNITTAVSYTHLDVYKRQVPENISVIARSCKLRLSSMILSWAPSCGILSASPRRRAFLPVSYTHLDVYKRQYQCFAIRR